MINERQLGSNPYLRARGESQLRAKQGFERRAGWLYGFSLGGLVVLIGYGWDAAQLALAHADFWWIKFALALVTILPLALLAGGIGGYVNWLLKIPVWALFGVASAYSAIHIPFDGSRVALQWFDPNLGIVEFLPMPAAAADSFNMLATLGAFIGLLVGLMQAVIVNWAWERSTEDFRFTPASAALFLLALPFAIGYSFLFDGTAHTPLRAPLQLINAVVQSGLNDAPNRDPKTLELHQALVYLTGQRWRAKLMPDYTVRLAASEPGAVGESFVDVTFSNGFNLRCRVTTYAEFVGECTDLNAEYSRYLTEFVPRGSFRCTACEMRVEPAAAAWRAANAHPLGATDQLTVRHGAGSSVTVRDTAANSRAFECLFSGVNPVVVEACAN